jgi:prepilin-type processing-associated H-X9-DG protein
MLIVETNVAIGMWTEGGPATIRGLDPAKQPYIGKGRQFGGSHPEGVQVLFVDGSVHVIRDSIEPRVFEAMATIAGGEKVAPFVDGEVGWQTRQ